MSKEQIIYTAVIVVIIIIIYLNVYFQNKRVEKAKKEMQDAIKKGDKIITYSGLSGEVDKVLEDRLIVKLYPDNTKISIEKWAVAGLDDRNIKE